MQKRIGRAQNEEEVKENLKLSGAGGIDISDPFN